nr:protein kinase [Kofleriaceae bacterium]
MNTLVTTSGLGLAQAADGMGALPPGAMAGPWRVERELGRGGMGVVYAVVHEEIGKRAALKVIHDRLGPSHAERALLEARVVNRVGHPNIVDIFETGTLLDGRPYIVMERLAGSSLAQRAHVDKIMPLEVIAILRQVCDALIAAHDAGVIHRDLKTDNVFLTTGADGGTHVKLLDWGIAKEISNDARRTIEGIVVGTPHYISPEQASGAAASDRSDVYALGVVAFELFLEQLPFEAETVAEIMTMHLRNAPPLPRELWPDIPRALEDLLLAMLAKEPAQRPCVRDVVARLEQVAGELEKRREMRSLAAGLIPPPARVSPRAETQASGELPSVPRRARVRRIRGWRAPSAGMQWLVGSAALAMSIGLLLLSKEPEGIAADVVESQAIAAPAAAAPVAATPMAAAPAQATPVDAPAPAIVDTEPVAAAPAQVEPVHASPAATKPRPASRPAVARAPARRQPTTAAKVRPDELAAALSYDPIPAANLRPTMTLATATHHATTAEAPKPRRLDPDGTLTPYQ